MLTLDRLTVRSGAATLGPITLEFAAGVHSLVPVSEPQAAAGTTSAGMGASQPFGGTAGAAYGWLLAAIAGQTARTDGNIRLASTSQPTNTGAQHASAAKIAATAARAAFDHEIAVISYATRMPTGLRLAALADHLATPHADAAAQLRAKLKLFGLGHRMHCRIGELDAAEARTAALALACARAARVVLIDAPYRSLLPPACDALETTLRELGEAGSVVLVASDAVGDARRLGGGIVLLENGQVFWRGESRDPWLRYPDAGTQLRIHALHTQALAAALIGLADVHVDAAAPGVLQVRHARTPATFHAVGELLAAADYGIESMHYATSSAEVVRANVLGDARAAYDAAYRAHEARALAQRQVAVEAGKLLAASVASEPKLAAPALSETPQTPSPPVTPTQPPEGKQ